jgi:3-methyladenine DNA glycosylase AlkD
MDAAQDAKRAVAELKRRATQKTRDGMARYAIPSERAFGVAMRDIQDIAKTFGKSHALAMELWKSGWYEARTMAAYVAEPGTMTSAEMERWCKDFDSWAICDTVCFVLFDKSPHAWKKVDAWAKRKGEIQKRTAFALLASLALHDKKAPDALFEERLALIEEGAGDERNFVKKGVSWALRSYARRGPKLRDAAKALATKLAASKEPGPRWVGKDALKGR